MFKKSFIVVVCIFVLSLSLSAFSSADASASLEEKSYTIGAVTLTSGHVFWNLIEENLIAKAEELGVKIEIRDGQSDSNVQYSEVQNFIAAGVNAIILSPADTGSSGAGDLAKEANVPLFYLNIKGQGDYVASVQTNEIQGGNNAGKWALDYIDKNLGGKAKCAIIAYDEIQVCVDRATGFKDVVSQHEGVEVLAEQTYSGDTEKAAAVTQDFLTQFPDLDIIFAVGDPAAQGALEVIKAQGAKTIVIGYDGNPEAYTAIMDETDGKIWKADVVQDPGAQAQMVIDLIVKYLNGEEVEKENLIDTYVIDADYISKNPQE
jgi:ribose transport system substrate-binding protein